MGFLHHKTLIAHGGVEQIIAAHAEITIIYAANYTELAGTVSPVIHGSVNSTASFMIAPDGSKEGWQTSSEGDAAFAQVKGYLKDVWPGSIDWVEVQIGGDYCSASILETNLLC